MTRTPTAAPWWDEIDFTGSDAQRSPEEGFHRGGACPTADRGRKPRSFRGETAAPMPALALVLAVAGIVFFSAQSPGSEAGPTTPAPEAESRAWTDSSGKYQVQATFRGLEDGKARLEKSDGRIIGIALEKLCEADQEYVRMQVSGEPAPQAPAGDEGRAEAAEPTGPETTDGRTVTPSPETPPEADSQAVGMETIPEPAPPPAQPAQDVEQTADDSSSSLPRSWMIGIAVAGGVLMLLWMGWWISAARRSARSRPAKSGSVGAPTPAARSSPARGSREVAQVAIPVAFARSSPAPSGLVQRARSALSYGQLDEKRLASDESYRISKVNEFSEIIDVAKDACRQAGRGECVSDLDTIMALGTILFLAWGELRPRLEAQRTALFAYSMTLVFCWTTPQSAIGQFALHEAKPGDTEEATAKLVTTTASTLKQMMAKLGLG